MLGILEPQYLPVPHWQPESFRASALGRGWRRVRRCLQDVWEGRLGWFTVMAADKAV